MRKNSQAAQKGPDARRRPRAAREAYSLYVERAAEAPSSSEGGFAPLPRPPPRIRCAGKAGARKWNTPAWSAMTCGSERPEPYRRRLGVPLRPRASPAPRKGEDSEGAVEAPSERTQQMGLFQQPARAPASSGAPGDARPSQSQGLGSVLPPP